MSTMIKLVVAAVGLAALAQAAEPKTTLRVGDAAPALAPGKWVKGEPVKAFAKGTVYVVEFWATWCPPCRESIPHLTELQAKFKDKGVVVIGQNCLEQSSARAADFVKRMGDKMNYRVALDDHNETMNKTWMTAAGQEGIPTAFVVDKEGKLAWIGHPLELDKVLGRVVAGTFDLKKEAELAAQREKVEQALHEAMQKGEFDKALQAADELAKLDPDEAAGMLSLRFQILLSKKEYAAAYALSGPLWEALKNDAVALNEAAWTVTTGPGLEKRDLELAEKFAARANELAKGEQAPLLDTLARVYFEKGQVAKAVEKQTQAVAKAKGEELRELKATLARYKAALPQK